MDGKISNKKDNISIGGPSHEKYKPVKSCKK
jgi:hypothetical protein